MLHDRDITKTCLCGSEKPFAFCCEPAIEGQKPAATAEALMRSRYTAFALGAVDYLVDTTAPEKRSADDAAIIAEQVKYTNWVGLKIIDRQAGGRDDDTGVVEFEARYETDEERGILHERSNFRRDAGLWLYVDGEVEVSAC